MNRRNSLCMGLTPLDQHIYFDEIIDFKWQNREYNDHRRKEVNIVNKEFISYTLTKGRSFFRFKDNDLSEYWKRLF